MLKTREKTQPKFYLNNETSNNSAMICHADVTGRANVNNSTTDAFHKNLPTNARTTSAMISAKIDATKSL